MPADEVALDDATVDQLIASLVKRACFGSGDAAADGQAAAHAPLLESALANGALRLHALTPALSQRERG
jgi:hypothetical protein